LSFEGFEVNPLFVSIEPSSLRRSSVKSILILLFLPLVGCASIQTTQKFLTSNGYIAIPLKRNAVGHFELVAEVNNVKGHFTLDTGASGTVLERANLKKFKIYKTGATVEAGGLGTAKSSAKFIKIRKIKIGTFERKNLKIVATDLSHVNKMLTKHGVQPQDGVLGGDILKSGKAIIDYESEILFLKI